MPDTSRLTLAGEGIDIIVPCGEHFIIRAFHPDDEARLRDMFAQCCRADVYMRCFAAIKDFPEQMASRLAQMNPLKEIALVATLPEGQCDAILGVAHMILEHGDDMTAEFDAMVRTDQKAHGIGYALMSALLVKARARGFRAVVGYILTDNRPMLQMVSELGFHVEGMSDGVAEVRIGLPVVG